MTLRVWNKELKKEFLEYLAMTDQQNRKAFWNFNSVAGSVDHDDDGEPICEYPEL